MDDSEINMVLEAVGALDGDVVLQDLLDWMQKDSSVLARKVKAGEQNGTDFWLVGSSVVLKVHVAGVGDLEALPVAR
ncbi:unnamed protein product [Effrenium voratum]|uniref:Uncharacterized protein n=1 Tax=Effrenium voratum TaxID=2562239 RepID=A0AA36N6R6_9DINO|nr:unnamed protein product [Effrenium voratum]